MRGFIRVMQAPHFSLFFLTSFFLRASLRTPLSTTGFLGSAAPWYIRNNLQVGTEFQTAQQRYRYCFRTILSARVNIKRDVGSVKITDQDSLQ